MEVSMPPHTSHRLQPLDVTSRGPLKGAFHKESDLFIKAKGLEKITPYGLAEILNKAYSQVSKIPEGLSVFKATAIYLLDPTIFSEEDFVGVNMFQSDNRKNIHSAHRYHWKFIFM
jgi:hypothetical protein